MSTLDTCPLMLGERFRSNTGGTSPSCQKRTLRRSLSLYGLAAAIQFSRLKIGGIHLASAISVSDKSQPRFSDLLVSAQRDISSGILLTNEVRPKRDRVSVMVPRDASSLILVRLEGGVPKVLLGRRSTTARFMPGYYVFPGGRVGPEDKLESWIKKKEHHRSRVDGRSLMRAAIRETYEETGLLLGYPVRHIRGRPPCTPLEGTFEAHGFRPAIDALKYIGRAITPRESSIRFNTRFFVADGRLAHGELASNGELDNLEWRSVEKCQLLPMADVTLFMLEHAMRSRAGAGHDSVVYHYVKGVARVRREAALRNFPR